MPNPTNPQSWNRYSYVRNNPVLYNDPTGHREDLGNVGNQRSVNCRNNPQYCNNGKPKSSDELREMRNKPDKAQENGKSPITNPGPVPTLSYTPYGTSIGTPIYEGDYQTGYNGGSGGLGQYSTNGTAGDALESVPLRYAASYDLVQYHNLMVVTIREHYWMPDISIPQGEGSTFGGSVLVAQLTNGQQIQTNLGSFAPGNLAHPNQLTTRDRTINYYGKENFPTQLVISISFGAEGVGASTVYYNLPFAP